MWLIEITNPTEVSSWLDLIKHNPVVIGALIAGLMLGMIITPFAQTRGWLSTAGKLADAAHIAKLEARIDSLEKELHDQAEELRLWRAFKEAQVDSVLNKLKTGAG